MGGSSPRPGPGPRASAASDDGNSLGVFTTDTDLAVRTWDPWLAAITGIAAERARGRHLTELIPDLRDRGLLAPFEQVLADGVVAILAPAFHRYLIPCPPQARSGIFDRMQQRVTIGPLRENDLVVGTIVAIEDVTARLEREREIAAELSALDAGQRLEAVKAIAEADGAGSPDPLVHLIGDEDWRVRRAAVKGLARRNTADVIASALRALKDDHRNFSVLSSAIELLAASQVDVLQPLLDLLGGPGTDPDLRLQAALVLGERGDPRALPGLLAVLDDPDENLRFHAIEALGRLRATAAVDRLLAIAESGEFFLAFPAVQALAAIGDHGAAPRLAPLLADDLLRGAVAETLGRLGDEDVVAPLTRLLNEATAPTTVIADALALVYERYEQRHAHGEQIATLVRRTIAPTGTQNLLDAIPPATDDQLRSLARVLGWLEGPAVERALTRLLGQPSVRARVVEYLVRHGARVVDLLVEQLRAEDLETREAAVVGLGRIGDRRATGPLLRLLDADPALTLAVAGALARIGDPGAFEPLLGLLDHRDAAVRQAVVAALNSIGHPEMAGRIVPLLRDPRDHVRESAVRIAGYFGYPECADLLLERCRDPEPAVQRAALEHLAFLDDPRVVPTLVGAVRHPDALVRAAAAQALGALDDPRAGQALAAAIDDPDPWVRYFAVRSLGGHRQEETVEGLARLAVGDPAGHVRLAAVEALGRLGSAAAIPPLARLSASEDEDVERAAAAIRSLGLIRHERVWPALRAALRHAVPDLRAAAAAAVGAQGGAAAVEALDWAAAADASDEVAASAIRALGALASNPVVGAGAVRSLVGLCAGAERRGLAVAALAAVPAGMVEHVAAGLGDPRPGVRAAIVQALGRMRRAEASHRLVAALDDEAAAVRLAALTELRYLGSRGIERKLITLARADADPVVRRTALAALQDLAGARPDQDGGAQGPG